MNLLFRSFISSFGWLLGNNLGPAAANINPTTKAPMRKGIQYTP